MNIADILRSLADKLEKIDGGEEAGGNQAADFQHDVSDGAEDGGAGDAEVGVMIPPLQQKLEILKKSAGMDNAYDDEQGTDELGDIKKLTGIQSVIGHVASEDNDIVG